MMQKLVKYKENKKGFTLVELIVVIAIIAILAAILLPKYFAFTDDARKSAAIADVKSIRSLAETYYATYGVWPLVELDGTAAQAGINDATAGTSTLVPDLDKAPGSTISSTAFKGTIGVDDGDVLTTDEGGFDYISDTGIDLSINSSGTVEVH